jgi:hypothetical protein
MPIVTGLYVKDGGRFDALGIVHNMGGHVAVRLFQLEDILNGVVCLQPGPVQRLRLDGLAKLKQEGLTGQVI